MQQELTYNMATITQGKTYTDTSGKTQVAQFNPNTGQKLSSGQSVAITPSGGSSANSSGSYGIDAKTGQPISTATDTPPTKSTGSAAPTANLQQGSSGQDVAALQNYLIQHGYLTADQVGSGAGTYGPKTTAAVAKLQQDLGINAGKAAGTYGPQTSSAAQKYQGVFSAVKDTTSPDSAAVANQTIQNNSQPSSDPVFGSLISSMAPIMDTLTQVLSNINNPALTAVSLQSEYNTLQQQYGLPQMQAEMLNMQNVMRGTDMDIRDEITKAGGTATESQVMGMTSARNTVILKQYNALATQYDAANTNVQNLMQYAATDQSTQMQRQTATASVVESMAGIQSQMMQMGMTMQQHTTDNLNKVVTNVGYQGLAAQAQDNPQMLSYYENSLGLAKGALSNPQSLKQLETLRQQTVALGQQRVNIQLYNSGLLTGQNPSGPPGTYVTPPGQSPVLVATKTSGNDSQGRPYTMNANQAQNMLKNGATTDPGTNNITVPGIGYYVAQPGGSYALSIDPSSAEGKFIQYRNQAENPSPWQPVGSLSNQRMTRTALTRQTNSALKQYVDSPLYQNVSSAATYFAKLYAGLNNPGSIGDPDIIDSLVKINTGGQGQITEQQYAAYAQGQTWADKFQVVQGKVVAKGGTLAPDQRTGIAKLAQDTFANYQSEYETMYVQAMRNLDNQGIPDAFWGNMPDWSGLIGGASFTPLPDPPQ